MTDIDRRRLVLGALAGAFVLPASSATAESVREQIVRQLQAQGFGDVRVGRTLLGRLRITARRGNLVREIIANPWTGEILRDYVSGRPVLKIPDPDDDDWQGGSEARGGHGEENGPDAEGGASGSGSPGGGDARDGAQGEQEGGGDAEGKGDAHDPDHDSHEDDGGKSGAEADD